MMFALERLRLARAQRLVRERLDSGPLVLGLTAFVCVGGLGLANGGYFPVSWGWAALGLLGLSVVLFARGQGRGVGALGLVFLVALVGLAIWTAVSSVWSLDVTHTVDEVERIVVYVSAAGCALMLLPRAGERSLLVGVWAAVTLLAGYGLAIWLFPQYLGFESAADRYRLSAPVGYWNAFGILAAVGTILALGLATRSQVLVVRACAGASTVVLVTTLFFTFSRGGWLALAGGLTVAFAIDRRRLQLATTTFVLAPWATAAVFAASRSSALTSANASLTAVTRDGHGLAVILIGLIALAGVAVVLLDTVEARFSVSPWVSRVYAVVLLAVVAVAIGSVFVKYGSPPALARRAYDAFNSAPITGENLNRRLFSLSGNGRGPQWHTAWQDVTAHPWLGSGAGTFAVWWFQHRQVRIAVQDVHNLYLETLAELGPVGLLLLVAALVVPLIAAVRARSHRFNAFGLGAYVAFLLHAAVDWDWEMPAVTLAALFCGLALLGRVAQERRLARLPGRMRLAGLAIVLPLMAFVVVTLLGNRALSDSSTDADAASYRAAKASAREAMGYLPWSAGP